MLATQEDLPFADDQLHRAVARIGELVSGRWHLDALIGFGGMASVYAATHRNGKRVAIKMLHPELSIHPDAKQRFLEEGYIANRVKHEGTASVFDDGETVEGSVFLVMELLVGHTLQELLQTRGTLPAGEVLAVAGGLLDILAAAHDAGIIHRDIKPANVFVTHRGAVRLLDFGIARLIGTEHPQTTLSGVAMGTPAFMPPEQARGHWEQVDARTDVWAVGATIFTALTGLQVHAASTANEELLAAMTTRAPSLGDIVPTAPRSLVKLVDQALAFEPANRWPDARAMRAALRATQGEVEPPPIPPAPTSEWPRTVCVVRDIAESPKASLIRQAMWIAKTQSWYILPKNAVSEISALKPKPELDHKRRGILAGAAAFVTSAWPDRTTRSEIKLSNHRR